MADTPKRRVGRPRTRTTEGRGEYVGFRAPPELKELLQAASATSHRSLSTEAQFRLEQSFRDLDQTLVFAYERPEVIALLMVLGGILRDAGNWASIFMGNEQPPGGWLDHPFGFQLVQQAVFRAFERLRPPGEPIPPQGLPPRLGEILADTRLQAIYLDGTVVSNPAITPDWAVKVRDRLPASVIERLAQGPKPSAAPADAAPAPRMAYHGDGEPVPAASDRAPADAERVGPRREKE